MRMLYAYRLVKSCCILSDLLSIKYLKSLWPVRLLNGSAVYFKEKALFSNEKPFKFNSLADTLWTLRAWIHSGKREKNQKYEILTQGHDAVTY